MLSDGTIEWSDLVEQIPKLPQIETAWAPAPQVMCVTEKMGSRWRANPIAVGPRVERIIAEPVKIQTDTGAEVWRWQIECAFIV